MRCAGAGGSVAIIIKAVWGERSLDFCITLDLELDLPGSVKPPGQSDKITIHSLGSAAWLCATCASVAKRVRLRTIEFMTDLGPYI